MKKRLIICCISIIIGLSGAGSVYAISIGFDPVSTSVILGENFIVEVVISGLGSGVAPSLGSYDIDVHFNQTMLSLDETDPNTVVFGDQLVGSVGSTPEADFGTPGVLSIAEASLDPSGLLDQDSSFVLATITFGTIGPGTSNLSFGFVQLVDASFPPAAINGISKGHAMVTVNPVPEPATMLLFGAGLVGLAGFGRRSIKTRKILKNRKK